jgi:hypothetical protein
MTLDEYLSSKIAGPNSTFKPPAWFMEAIESVARAGAPVPKAPPVMFKWLEEQFDSTPSS